MGVWWREYKQQAAQDYVITWEEFRTAFSAHHILQGVLDMKREEFINLKQGNRLVQYYVNSFNHLAQYAPDDVNTDHKKQALFNKGLSLKLQNQHNAFDFREFNHFVSKAITEEASLKALEADDLKWAGPSSGACGSNQRARTRPPPPPPQTPGFGDPHPMWMDRRSPSLQQQAPHQAGQPGGGGGGFGPCGSCFNCGGQGHLS